MAVLARKNISLLLVLKIVVMLTVLAYAAGLTLNSKNYVGEKGGQLKVTNGLLSVDKGFSRAGSAISAASTSCATNVTFTSSPRNANTTVTVGNIVFNVQVNTTGSAPINTCFQVKLVITRSDMSQSTFGPVYVATGATVTGGQTINCKFDLQTTTLPASPFSFKLTVQ